MHFDVTSRFPVHSTAERIPLKVLSASKVKDPNTDLQMAIVTKSRVAYSLHGDKHYAWLLTEEGPDKAGLLFLKGIFIDIILGGGSNPQILKLFLNWCRVVFFFLNLM